MKTQHLSDQSIQEFVLSKSNERSVTDHLRACEVCQTKVAVYQDIILGIKDQSHAEFDFDLAETVMAKIEERRATYSYLFWLLAVPGIGILFIGVYFFGKHLAMLFSGVTEMTCYLVVTTAVTVLLFQGIEIARKYNGQMRAMNFS